MTILFAVGGPHDSPEGDSFGERQAFFTSYQFSFTHPGLRPMNTLTRSSRRTSPLRSLQGEVNRLFESVFPGTMEGDDESVPAVWSPRMDLRETDDHYQVQADLPGVSKEDVSITVEDNQLTIRGERQAESRTEDDHVVRMERAFGSFYRSIRLPRAVDESEIKATFTDGVLTVTLPKTEKSRPKKIEIS